MQFFYIKNERIGRIDFLKFCMADPSHVILIMNGKNKFTTENAITLVKTIVYLKHINRMIAPYFFVHIHSEHQN